MYYDGWEIEIKDRVATLLTDIWIFRKERDGKFALWRNEKIQSDYDPTNGLELPPTLTIPTDLMPGLLEKILDKNFQPPAESYTKGKLDATESHLKDLRTLLKLPL